MGFLVMSQLDLKLCGTRGQLSYLLFIMVKWRNGKRKGGHKLSLIDSRLGDQHINDEMEMPVV
jgi:hypothetical protein